MPAGIKNDALWQKAKAEIDPTWDKQENPWAVVMQRYKDMGGEATPEAEEACSSGQMGALMRAGEAAGDWRDKAPRYVSLNEATVDRSKREVRCILITEGPGNTGTKNYYTPEFIHEAAKKYNGARAYLNHATEAQYRSRPEGDIRELCGFYRDTKVVQVRDKKTGETVSAVEGTLCFDKSEAGDQGLAKAEAQIEYAKLFPDSPEEYCGLSISGTGLREGTVDIAGQKWNRIVGVGQADSVDVVTRPARGGAFLAITESAGKLAHLPKEEAIMLKKAIAIAAKITEATQRMSEAKSDADRTKIKAEIEALNKQMKEATDGPMDPTHKDEPQDIAMLKQLIPKAENEADEAYNERLAKVKAAFAPKADKTAGDPAAGSQESVRNMDVDTFKTQHPKLYEAIAGQALKSVEGHNGDIKVLEGKLREANIELQLLRDKELATNLLSEASIPTKILSVGDLLGLSESEMKREIERAKALIESAGGRVRVPSSAAGGSTASSASARLKESIAKLKSQAGVAA